MQKILWDRRLCLRILDQMGIPTPKRLEVNRDGGPTLESPNLAKHMLQLSGVKLEGPEDGTGGGAPKTQSIAMIDDGDTILVDGQPMKKPFVEKPVNGGDHDIRIYFPKNQIDGGGRKLFRKIGSKSSEYDPNMVIPRSITDEESYVYEQFLRAENDEDVKAYTVGPAFCYAETRRSPAVHGVVRRNTHGKEMRYVTSLSKEESAMATKITNAFGQRVCGFDLLRAGDMSYVIDVNGWSLAKNNDHYNDTCATILREMFIQEKGRKEGTADLAAESTHHKPPSHHHRTALKGQLKSAGLLKRTGQNYGNHHDNNSRRQHSSFIRGNLSPEFSISTPPMPSEPSMDRNEYITLPKINTQIGRHISPGAPIVSRVRIDPVVSGDDSYVLMSAAKHSWKLKGMVAVIRNGDRTPKQKLKFSFHTQPFVELLRGYQGEVLLKGESALNTVMEAVKQSLEEGLEDRRKLKQLHTALARKGAQAGTKVQIKPMFRKRRPKELPADTVPENSETIATSPQATMANSSMGRNGNLSIPQRQADATRMQPGSDSISGTTFSRFSAAENDLVLDKLQLVMKWGGEPIHSTRYQAQDVGESMRNDMLLLNREILNDVRIFTSSDTRVSTSGEFSLQLCLRSYPLTIVARIWAASFLGRKDVPDDYIEVRKDVLDDSNAAKDVMNNVKKKLKILLRKGSSAPLQFAWPENMDEPSVVMAKVIELMKFHRQVMRDNFKNLGKSTDASLAALNGFQNDKSESSGTVVQAQAVLSIQSRWCTGENAELFKERWEKLFMEFCDSKMVDPSKISELYDSIKYDVLHNRQFLEWAFTPSTDTLEEQRKRGDFTTILSVKPAEKCAEGPTRSGSNASDNGKENRTDIALSEKPIQKLGKDKDNDTLRFHESLHNSPKMAAPTPPPTYAGVPKPRSTLAQRVGLPRQSVVNSSTPPQVPQEENQHSYVKLFQDPGGSKAKAEKPLVKFRELYRFCKVLFDFVALQEYGIEDHEKLEIGLLTSLPLLKEIVLDLEELQASDHAKSFIYFTKESHIHTLLNCILEGGVKAIIPRNEILELDYLSQICFELWEAEDTEMETFSYSIRITISPGCHTADPLDSAPDSKHVIGGAPRRSLTSHADWKEVIETLRAKFHT
jgi:inositol hexakisphosphate/diphosphoinositol-pentakisphosphate kinase